MTAPAEKPDRDALIRRLERAALPDPHDEREVMHAPLLREAAKALAGAPPAAVPRTAAERDVVAERARQVSQEGWTPEHDDRHGDGCLAVAAASYALHAASQNAINDGWKDTYAKWAERGWPFDDEWWKPSDARRELLKAGALILAEIERLDCAAPAASPAMAQAEPDHHHFGERQLAAFRSKLDSDIDAMLAESPEATSGSMDGHARIDPKTASEGEGAAPVSISGEARGPDVRSTKHVPNLASGSQPESSPAHSPSPAEPIAAIAPPEPVAWRCFHCDETFADPAQAETHFGRYDSSVPACVVDVAEYRCMEQTLSLWQSEDTDLHREIGKLNARLSATAREDEEAGYAKGLADGRAAPAIAPDALWPSTENLAREIAMANPDALTDDGLLDRLKITRSYLANHPTRGSWYEAGVVEQAVAEITRLRATLRAATGDDARELAAWRPLLDKVTRTIDQWNEDRQSPMAHPFSSLLADARAALAAQAQEK